MAILKPFEPKEGTAMRENESETISSNNLTGRKKKRDKSIGPASFDGQKSHVNITELIRSVQRTEGKPDCFRKNAKGCDDLECEWRPYCLTVLPATEK